MKKLGFFCLIAIIIIPCVYIIGCELKDNTRLTGSKNIGAYYNILDYKKLNTLSKVIALVEVERQSLPDWNRITYDVKIIEDIKGEHKKGDIIRIGLSPHSEVMSENSNDSIPQLQNGKEYVLILSQRPGEEYLPYFLINNVQCINEVTGDKVLVNPENQLMKELNGKSKDKFLSMLKQKIEN